MIQKSFKEISWNVTEPEYRADPAYSQSTIAKFNRTGFEGLPKLFEQVITPSLVFGSMVDTLLTDGQQAFDDKFIIAKYPPVSDSIMLITKRLHAKYPDILEIEGIPEADISKIAKDCNYYANERYDNSRAKIVIKEARLYYQFLVKAGDKILINELDYYAAAECVNVLKVSPTTEWYFKQDDVFNPDIERLYQLKFKGSWEGIDLRGMADLIIVDHKNKIVFPKDLKTSSSPEYHFFHSFIKWNYWIQAQLYWYLIRQTMDRDEYFKDFKLMPFEFIVINRNSLRPLVWEYKDTTSIVDLYYGKSQQYFCRNWRGIVKELHEYLTNKSSVPIGIDCNGSNDIVDWLNNE